MNIPEEFTGRVCRTNVGGLSSDLKKLSELLKEWPASEVDVIFETRGVEKFFPVVVNVFETGTDHLAFKLKHGNKYV